MKYMFTCSVFIIILGITSSVDPLTPTGQSPTTPAHSNPPSSDPNFGHSSAQSETGSCRKQVIFVVKVSNP